MIIGITVIELRTFLQPEWEEGGRVTLMVNDDVTCILLNNCEWMDEQLCTDHASSLHHQMLSFHNYILQPCYNLNAQSFLDPEDATDTTELPYSSSCKSIWIKVSATPPKRRTQSDPSAIMVTWNAPAINVIICITWFDAKTTSDCKGCLLGQYIAAHSFIHSVIR